MTDEPPETSASGPRDPATLLAGAVAAISLALMGANVLPLLLGGLMDEAGLDESRAGWLGSIELGAMAAASFLLAPRLGAWSRGRVAIAAGAVAVAGHLATIGAPGFGSLAAMRLLAGLGEGGVLAAANAGIATSVDPDRLYAKVSVAAGVLGAVLLALLPLPIGWWGRAGGFGAIAILSLGCLPFVTWLPDAERGARRVEARRPAPPGGGVALLVGCLLIGVAEGALWAFAERIGVRTGLSAGAVGSALAGTTIAGISGAGLAAWLGTRFGRARPVALGALALGASLFVLAASETPGPFVAALLASSVAYFWLTPYLLGTAAALDPTGRVAAAAAGATLVGNAAGPGLAGSLVAVWGYASLGWLSVVLCALVLAGVTPVTLRTERGAAKPADGAGHG